MAPEMIRNQETDSEQIEESFISIKNNLKEWLATINKIKNYEDNIFEKINTDNNDEI